MTLGERIKMLRERKGWGQRELSRQANVRHATISRLERGVSNDVTMETAKRLARALDVDLNYLCGFYEDLMQEQDSKT